MQQCDQSVENSNTAVNSLGDAAFWDTQTGSPDVFELNMCKGNVANFLLGGNAPDGSIYLSGTEQIAYAIPHISGACLSA